MMVDEVDRVVEQMDFLEQIAARNRRQEITDAADECIECGCLIPSERQIALPGTQICIDCAELYETAKQRYK
jgi:RNA polymerase-binding transcription factor DksA